MTNQTLPKLKIDFVVEGSNLICDAEQARSRIEYSPSFVIVVDGKVIHSHDELIRLLSQDKYRGQDVVEVLVLPFIEGG